MPTKAFFLFFLFIVELRVLSAPLSISPARIKLLYQKAEGYFMLVHPTERTDSLALDLFGKVIGELGKNRFDDGLLFQAYLKKAVLLDVKGNYAMAVRSYSDAILCVREHTDWKDSLLFKAYVYCGPAYYHLEKFDSANFMLHQAELLAVKYPGLPEQERLYNTLGALNYESGNYLQSKNYFNRALLIVRADKQDNKISATNFENNIASCLYKLGEYRGSLEIYRGLLKSGNLSSQICLNMGKAYVSLREYDQALAAYRKVAPDEVPGVLNEIAYAQLLRGRNDSATYYLDKWRNGIKKDQQTPIDAGVNDLYRSEAIMARGQFQSAIGYMQQAIIAFSGTFKNTDIYANPVNFIGSFASYRLFDALSHKAAALEKLYGSTHQEKWLLASFSTYSSALLLFRYMEKSYTMDDAKLFLKRNNSQLYGNTVQICLRLDSLHPGAGYLEQAFITAEKSKASILSDRVEQLISMRTPGVNGHLMEMEKNIKYNIARLDLKSDPEQGNPHTQGTARQKADYEIELSMIQQQMESNGSYYRLKYRDSCPGIQEIQRHLNDRQAMISLYVAGNGLHLFILTSSSFHHLLIDSIARLRNDASDWIAMLTGTAAGRRFGDKRLAKRLYNGLVRQLLDGLPGKTEWIVIPNDIFSLLPFESLPGDENNGLLIEKITISYELSTQFLNADLAQTQKAAAEYKVLSFAPFGAKGNWINTRSLTYMDALPYSLTEIRDLPGRKFMDEQASKQHFLEQMNHYPVIHLATHALLDPRDVSGSFVAFYPQRRTADEDCLFLEELYGINLDSTRLIILSACETGAGEIVGNEGLLSLSRGFMYAGCPSVVNSLWKADDRSTAAILRTFHIYLEKGYSKAAALRQAKLDYIHSDELYITPDYWANLVLIGNTDPIMEKKKSGFLYLFVLIGSLLAIIGLRLLWRLGSAYRHDSSP